MEPRVVRVAIEMELVEGIHFRPEPWEEDEEGNLNLNDTDLIEMAKESFVDTLQNDDDIVEYVQARIL